MSFLLDSVYQNINMQMAISQSESDNIYDIYNNVIDKKDITTFDKYFVADKQLWTPDVKLNEYPSNNSHYLVDNKVYLCIQNNDTISTVKPEGVSIFNFRTDDGYVWRYLFTLQTDDHLNHVRLETSLNKPAIRNSIARLQDYSIDVQFNKKPSISVVSDEGTGCVIDFTYDENKISDLYVSSGGNNYKKDDYVLISEDDTGNDASIDYEIVDGKLQINSFEAGGNYVDPKIHVLGDGEGASVTSQVTNGSFSDISLENEGSGYTWVKLIIAPSKNSTVKKIFLESPNGFGYEPKYDIDSKLMLSKTFKVDIETKVNYVLITSKVKNNEYPQFYSSVQINDKTLSQDSDNLIQVIIDESI